MAIKQVYFFFGRAKTRDSPDPHSCGRQWQGPRLGARIGYKRRVKFSALLREAILSADADLDHAKVGRLQSTILELLQGWVAVHEPDLPEDQLDDPQRALVLMMLEELEDRAEIPIVE